MSRILFLDDSEPRHRKFRQKTIGHRVTFVRTHDEALAALAGERFDEVWLDHDLSEAAAAGQPASGEKTGYDVACAIAALPPNKRPRLAYVHSLNPPGSERIVQALVAAGIRTHRVHL